MYEASGIKLDSLRSKLPKPSGWRILVAIPEVNEKTEGGVWLPGEEISREKTASVIGLVIALGPDCYDGEDKYPSGPWCKEGDWVMFRSYSGTRFKIDKQDFRFINDDTVEGVVADPRGIIRS